MAIILAIMYKINIQYHSVRNKMKHRYSISEAKNRLTSIIHGVETGDPVQLTRHGKPVAILLSLNKYEALKQKNKNFWNSLISFRQSMDKEEDNLDDCFDHLRDRSTGRDVEF